MLKFHDETITEILADGFDGCGSCRYWDHVLKEGRFESSGECRFRSPAINPNGKATWPHSHAMDWCAKHEPNQLDGDLAVIDDNAGDEEEQVALHRTSDIACAAIRANDMTNVS